MACGTRAAGIVVRADITVTTEVSDTGMNVIEKSQELRVRV